MTDGAADPVRSAFRRLLSEAANSAQARVDALVALSQRTVLAVAWLPPNQGYRTLVNGSGESALPVFTELSELREAAARFGWLAPDGRAPAAEIGAREALRFVSHNRIGFLVVDITAEHALEVSREELEPLLASTRSDAAGPFAAVGRISSTLLEVASRRSTPPPMSAVRAGSSLPAAGPLGVPESSTQPRPGMQPASSPALPPTHRGSSPALPVTRASSPVLPTTHRASSPALPSTQRASSPALPSTQRASSPSLPTVSPAQRPSAVPATALHPRTASSPALPVVGRASPTTAPSLPTAVLPERVAPAPGGPLAEPPSDDHGVSLTPVTLPPPDALLSLLSDQLRAYPEVEWAAFCLASRGEEGPRPAIGLRVDLGFRQRVHEIVGKLMAVGVTHGMSLEVVLLDDPQLVREARQDALLFFPWRKRASSP